MIGDEAPIAEKAPYSPDGYDTWRRVQPEYYRLRCVHCGDILGGPATQECEGSECGGHVDVTVEVLVGKSRHRE